jgi:2-polyprenyl-3-methyl-5-hydroxy-6-metoxy-1,4-benzoquinol methylase
MSTFQPALLDQQSPDQIRSRPYPACYLCGAPGVLLYEGVKDRLFGASGTWHFKRCPNPACGLLWLDPMPLEEDIAKAYCSYYTHQEDPLPPDNFVRRVYCRMRRGYLYSKYGYHCVRRSRWDQLLAHLIYLGSPRQESIHSSVFWLKSKPNGRLLEVGCGSGAMMESMKELGWQVEGVDFDPVAVEQARSKGLTVHLGTLTEQELPGNTFDAIAANHVIEHVPDPIALLRECRRLLRPGGLLVLITPNASSWGHRLYLADWRGLEPPRHLHIFTRSSLAATCTQAGFNPGHCRSVVRASSILLQSRMLRRTGKADSARRPSRTLQFWTEVISLLQWVVSLVDTEAGEEIVLISAK